MSAMTAKRRRVQYIPNGVGILTYTTVQDSHRQLHTRRRRSFRHAILNGRKGLVTSTDMWTKEMTIRLIEHSGHGGGFTTSERKPADEEARPVVSLASIMRCHRAREGGPKQADWGDWCVWARYESICKALSRWSIRGNQDEWRRAMDRCRSQHNEGWLTRRVAAAACHQGVLVAAVGEIETTNRWMCPDSHPRLCSCLRDPRGARSGWWLLSCTIGSRSEINSCSWRNVAALACLTEGGWKKGGREGG
jgi:hypothetical protein